MVKKITLNRLEIHLLAERALFIPHYDMLVISDWHLGKLGHFRKEGLFVPPMQLEQEFERLAALLENTNCKQVVFLGDLFHSDYNYEWDQLVLFLNKYPEIKFILTTGNHDILAQKHLLASPIQQEKQIRLAEGIVLSHEPIRQLDSHWINIVGHIHPGCEIIAKGRQRFRMPCFVLESDRLTMPAFGQWTGLYIIPKAEHNRIFPILNTTVAELKK